ncbi:unknown protein [Microcystis aeruginosa NIES-843]|uniref:Uncharacterized protein n=1 Tax=Microcystis aeruginosa (strain NIES-843 / IAM M-2473) TaxID=449447 RepID=B0JJK6_MICAN|nr:unknown protein [Microcystis aeruginosa NIES-843]
MYAVLHLNCLGRIVVQMLELLLPAPCSLLRCFHTLLTSNLDSQQLNLPTDNLPTDN